MDMKKLYRSMSDSIVASELAKNPVYVLVIREQELTEDKNKDTLKVAN